MNSKEIVDPRPSTKQSTSLKSGSLFLMMVSVHNRSKSFKLVLWLVLGRGSLYDSCLVFMYLFAVMWSPFWGHIAQAWHLRDHENLLFIRYSDMKKVTII